MITERIQSHNMGLMNVLMEILVLSGLAVSGVYSQSCISGDGCDPPMPCTPGDRMGYPPDCTTFLVCNSPYDWRPDPQHLCSSKGLYNNVTCACDSSSTCVDRPCPIATGPTEAPIASIPCAPDPVNCPQYPEGDTVSDRIHCSSYFRCLSDLWVKGNCPPDDNYYDHRNQGQPQPCGNNPSRCGDNVDCSYTLPYVSTTVVLTTTIELTTTTDPTTTEVTTTMQPTTTDVTTTEKITTTELTTQATTTLVPSTIEASTLGLSTIDPSTIDPTTIEPTTLEPSLPELTSLEITTVEPSTIEIFTVDPSSLAPSSIELSTGDLSTLTAVLSTEDFSTEGVSTDVPSTTIELSTGDLSTLTAIHSTEDFSTYTVSTDIPGTAIELSTGDSSTLPAVPSTGGFSIDTVSTYIPGTGYETTEQPTLDISTDLVSTIVTSTEMSEFMTSGSVTGTVTSFSASTASVTSESSDSPPVVVVTTEIYTSGSDPSSMGTQDYSTEQGWLTTDLTLSTATTLDVSESTFIEFTDNGVTSEDASKVHSESISSNKYTSSSTEAVTVTKDDITTEIAKSSIITQSMTFSSVETDTTTSTTTDVTTDTSTTAYTTQSTTANTSTPSTVTTRMTPTLPTVSPTNMTGTPCRNISSDCSEGDRMADVFDCALYYECDTSGSWVQYKCKEIDPSKPRYSSWKEKCQQSHLVDCSDDVRCSGDKMDVQKRNIIIGTTCVGGGSIVIITSVVCACRNKSKPKPGNSTKGNGNVKAKSIKSQGPVSNGRLPQTAHLEDKEAIYRSSWDNVNLLSMDEPLVPDKPPLELPDTVEPPFQASGKCFRPSGEFDLMDNPMYEESFSRGPRPGNFGAWDV